MTPIADPDVCKPPPTEDLIGQEMDFECGCGRRWRLEHYFGRVPSWAPPGSCSAPIIEALSASAWGEVPPKGPRGGARWSPRFFVRRSAWHVLDHAWEIGDRIDGSAS